MELTNNGSASRQKTQQTNAWPLQPQASAEPNHLELVHYPALESKREPRVKIHACRASQRGFHEATERLNRANRDLGETAAFVAASLSTLTAVEAVVNFALDKIGLSREFVQVGLVAYITLFVLLLVWGTFRARDALRRRSQAEKDIDQAQKGIFEFCPGDPWQKLEKL